MPSIRQQCLAALRHVAALKMIVFLDKHNDRSGADTSLSSLSGDLYKAVDPKTGDGHSPWPAPSEIATADLSSDVEPWNFDANAASSPSKFPRDDWELPGPDTPLSSLSSLSVELIDPELQDDFSSSKSSLPGTTDLVKGAYRSISTTNRKHMEGIVTAVF
jgi:hypothetical protein